MYVPSKESCLAEQCMCVSVEKQDYGSLQGQHRTVCDSYTTFTKHHFSLIRPGLGKTNGNKIDE